MRQTFKDLRVVRSIKANVGNNTTDGTGVGVSRVGFNKVAVFFDLGISGDTLSGSVKFLAGLEESLDSTNGVNGTWTAVAAGSILSNNSVLVDDPLEDDVMQMIEYKGSAPYIRPVVTFTGTHTVGTPISAYVLLSEAFDAPVTQGT